MKLVSSVQADIEAFPLCLPPPDGINNGGYCIPTPEGSMYAYSPIDILIAGLEASRLDITISDLPAFFCKKRVCFSANLVYVAIQGDDGFITSNSMQWWLLLAESQKSKDLVRIFNKNAPLFFRWVQV